MRCVREGWQGDGVVEVRVEGSRVVRQVKEIVIRHAYLRILPCPSPPHSERATSSSVELWRDSTVWDPGH